MYTNNIKMLLSLPCQAQYGAKLIACSQAPSQATQRNKAQFWIGNDNKNVYQKVNGVRPTDCSLLPGLHY